MPKPTYLTIWFIFCTLGLSAQVVTSDPALPTVEAPFTITFDATKGNAGLLNCNCDVYIHTGLITDKSTFSTDWRYVQGEWGKDIQRLKMVKESDNLYSFQLDIPAFYGVPASESVQKIAFVFRDVTGERSGREADGSDIFLNVFEADAELEIQLTKPQNTPTALQSGTSLTIAGSLNKLATVSIQEAGNIIFQSVEETVNFSHDYLPPHNSGTHTIEVIAKTTMGFSDTISFDYLVYERVPEKERPKESAFGLNRNDDGTVTFVLHAPEKDNAFLLGDFNNWTVSTDYLMNRTPDDQAFWLTIPLNGPVSDWYRYQYLVDGDIRIADPYSELVLDPVHDPFIPSFVNNSFPDYPEEGEGIVSAFKVEGFPYEWQISDFEAPEEEGLFIYEILLRDFLESHSYEDLIDTLDYLQRLGVNAVELMPVNEFEGNLSWGYNPSFHMALDKYYGDPVTFKRFVDESHRRGIAVILDIVLNHAFSQSPLAQLYWDVTNFKPTPDNPWLNRDATHPFNVGYDFNHESQATVDFVERVVKFWIEEYHIDGYRFDLSKGFTQTVSGDNVGLWSSFDQSRIDILQNIADKIWDIAPESILILEHFGGVQEEVTLSRYGFLLWGNANFNYNEATMGYHDNGKSDFSAGYYPNRMMPAPKLVTYMESHDEERIMYKNLAFGNSFGSYSVKNRSTALERTQMAHAFFWTIPGPKMMWQFGELGYEFSINRCKNGEVKEDCRLDEKPIRWDYQLNPERSDLYDWISDLTYLKRQFPESFKAELRNVSLSSPYKAIHFGDDNLRGMVVGNFDVQSWSSFDSGFHIISGTWYDYRTGDSIVIRDQTLELDLNPGEFHVFLNKRIERPSRSLILTSTSDAKTKNQSRVSLLQNPLPYGNQLQVILEQFPIGDWTADFYGIDGRLVFTQNLEVSDPIWERKSIGTERLNKGAYVLRLRGEGTSGIHIRRVIVH